jgi:hypothetical protein
MINEVFYDPAGSDGGYEFVELFNGSPDPVCLAGWQLETGNGSYENRWKLEWTGMNADTMAPHSFWVIGEARVLPTPDFVEDLDLQNGPDGCRLVRADGTQDVVGWGDLIYSEYYEGTPSVRSPSGSSIGRDPDGSDSDDNSVDFRALESPSPGDFNHPPCDLAVERAGLSRYTSTSGADLDIACRIASLGTHGCGEGGSVSAMGAGYAASTLLPYDLDPGQSIRLVVRVPSPGEGIHMLRVWHAHGHDRWHWNDTLTTSIVVRPPPVVINEIMFKPGTHECEWIELLCHGAGQANMRGWTLEDYTGRARSITGEDAAVIGGDYVLLVEDEEVFHLTHPEGGSALTLRPEGGWPTLNDVDGPLDLADVVVIRDSNGTMVDSVAYRQRWSEPGISVERVDPRARSWDSSNWSPHYGGTTGSPGARNSVSFYLPNDGNILSLSPQTFSPDGNGEHDLLAISLRFPAASLTRLSIFDINGRLVTRLIDGEVVEASRTTFWDGTRKDGSNVPMGVYLILLEAEAVSSGSTYGAKAPVILVRR